MPKYSVLSGGMSGTLTTRCDAEPFVVALMALMHDSAINGNTFNDLGLVISVSKDGDPGNEKYYVTSDILIRMGVITEEEAERIERQAIESIKVSIKNEPAANDDERE